ncbi:cobalamin biosynthesis protein CobD [Candidatus Magnetoovum chiemensis]|nr:cobalamin biosynthesis protein CobD [Candidatus Magnetoovum chiemensis]
MITNSIQLTTAFICDRIIPAPQWLPHPVKLIGWLISFIEHRISKQNSTPQNQIIRGGILVFIVVSATFAAISMIEFLLNIVCPNDTILFHLIMGILGSFTIAARELKEKVTQVLELIQHNEIELARKHLSFIVGRDTQNLDKEAVTKAAIETLAENTSDGIIAPLFYFAIGGLPFAFAYKAVNTIDSMIGYKNDKYLYFGRVGAKLDDIVNYIPARITAALLVVSAYIYGIVVVRAKRINIDARRGFDVMLRDGRKHTSPNAGMPEAAMAGILGIRLGGPNYYGGMLVNKPYIGDSVVEANVDNVNHAALIVDICSIMFLLTIISIRKMLG